MSAIEQVTQRTRLAEIPFRLTYEEYLAWDEFEGGLTEWVNGKVEFHMPPFPNPSTYFCVIVQADEFIC